MALLGFTQKHGPFGELFFFLIQKKLGIAPNSETFDSFIGDGLQVPDKRDESVSSGGSQEGNVSNDTLHVIGLHGSGDKISLFSQDWELVKVALSCHMALDMLCQEMYEVERKRGWFWVLSGPVGLPDEPPCHKTGSFEFCDSWNILYLNGTRAFPHFVCGALFFVCIRRSKGGLVRLLKSLDADKLRCVVFVLGT